jgi:hypothetical protein
MREDLVHIKSNGSPTAEIVTPASEDALPTPTPWLHTRVGIEDCGYSHISSTADGFGDIATSWGAAGNAIANAELIVKAVNTHASLWDRIRKVEFDNEQAAARIRRLEADLNECREFLENQVDVTDGPDGQPLPNKAMRLCAMIDETINGRPY